MGLCLSINKTNEKINEKTNKNNDLYVQNLELKESSFEFRGKINFFLCSFSKQNY